VPVIGRLGIESEQAMELFHQTVSMKSVGDLNEFVRSHMLEPFDARGWIDRLVGHFDDLTKAHDAVVKARAQRDELTPLLADCDAYDALGDEIASLEAERSALPLFCAERKAGLLERRIDELDGEIAAKRRDLGERGGALTELEQRRDALVLERAGHGGDRLGELERQIGEAEHARDTRRKRWDRFNELLRQADLPAVERAEQFHTRLREIIDAAGRADSADADLRNRATEVAADHREVKRESDEINAELVSLRSRRSSIPARSLELRSWLCGELRLAEADLPFAGELIQVRPKCSEWEGAAERVLRGFGLSLLVPDEHYRAVSEWINEHHLRSRLVYQFKLEWGAVRSKSFRFVVIDEAFGRGSDESTRYALELFARLGLQLLIVTPLQKIHVIEPYVSSVGFVDNTQEGDYSRLQRMTIEEYRERRLAHTIAQSAQAAAPA
jgi:uncharacterized protein YPO0396